MQHCWLAVDVFDMNTEYVNLPSVKNIAETPNEATVKVNILFNKT